MEWLTAYNGKRKKGNSLPGGSPEIQSRVKKAKSSKGRVPNKPPSRVQPKQPAKVTTTPVPGQSSPASVEPAKDPAESAGITFKVVKPVFVEHNFQVVNNHVNNVQFSKKPLLKIANKLKIQVSCYTIEDKLKLIASLNEKKLKNFTYSEASEKSSIFVLRGHHKVKTEELLATIQAEGIQATKVTFLSDNEEAPLYIVHFEKGTTNINSLIYEHKTIGNLMIKWEKLDHNRKRPTQCHRCQQWGHSARNCGRDYRCVKCTNTHEIGKCERTTRDGDAKCVNCQGNHPANSRQCTAFLKYQERTTRRRAPTHFTSTPAPWANNGYNPRRRQADFPPLTTRQAQQNHQQPLNSHAQHPQQPLGNRQTQYDSDSEESQYDDESQHPVSFSQPRMSTNARPSRRVTNGTNSFATLHAKFQSIPEIDTTMRLFNDLVRELGSTLDQPARMMIMMRYCFPDSTQNAH